MSRMLPDRLATELISASTWSSLAAQPPPAAVIGVQQSGVVEFGAAGFSNPAGDLASPATVFDLASVSKLITTAAIMRLVDSGEVTLDAGIDAYVQGVGDPVPTIRQLLQHRAGLLPWQPLYLQARDRDSALALLKTLPRRSDPDVEFSYSDLGFMLLGEVIEQVIAPPAPQNYPAPPALESYPAPPAPQNYPVPLPQALHRLVIEPLGLEITSRPTGTIAASSYGSRAEAEQVRTAKPYPILLAGDYQFRTETLIGEVNDTNAYACFDGLAGHAGLFGTVGDLLRLGSAFVTTEHGLWRAETLSEFTAAGPDPLQALGFRTRQLAGERTMLWHPGFTGTALAVIVDSAVPPEDQSATIIAMTTNRLLQHGAAVPTPTLFRHVLRGLGFSDVGDQQ